MGVSGSKMLSAGSLIWVFFCSSFDTVLRVGGDFLPVSAFEPVRSVAPLWAGLERYGEASEKLLS
jgi:hypothetical protein